MQQAYANRYECSVCDYKDMIKVCDYEQTNKTASLYSGTATFLSSDHNLSQDTFLDKDITLVIRYRGSDQINYVSGVITQFIPKGKIGKRRRYEVIFEPHLSKLNRKRSDVVLGHTIPELIENYLNQAKIKHYRFDLYKEYNIKPFLCQYNESDFSFINRYIESEGLCFYFEQEAQGEVIVFSDQYSNIQEFDEEFNEYYLSLFMN